jgi:hypothetical protein
LPETTGSRGSSYIGSRASGAGCTRILAIEDGRALAHSGSHVDGDAAASPLIEHHVEEEKEMFKLAEKLGPERLAELADEMESAFAGEIARR